MTTDHERRDLADIEALSVEFWYRVDHQNGVGVADLFTEDGVYSVAERQNAGRAAIAESYVMRARPRTPAVAPRADEPPGERSTRPQSPRGLSILTLWADDGEAPLELKMPISVTDVEDEYVKESDGKWRIRHRHLSQVFLGDGPGVLPMGTPRNASKGDDDALRHQ